jgi:hypothetical protein
MENARLRRLTETLAPPRRAKPASDQPLRAFYGFPVVEICREVTGVIRERFSLQLAIDPSGSGCVFHSIYPAV